MQHICQYCSKDPTGWNDYCDDHKPYSQQEYDNFMKKQRVLVKQPENENIPMEALAEHIVKIGQAFAVLKSSRLKERTILLLLQDITKLAQRDIKKVLDAMQVLESVYLKPKAKTL